MSNVTSLLETMESRFDASAADDLDAIFQYDIEDEGSWQVTISDNQCSIVEGEPEEATVNLAMTLDTFSEILSGETDGMQAFMSGELKATGDIMLATRLTALFPVS